MLLVSIESYGEPDVAKIDVAALFLTFDTRLRKTTPRTRANIRENQYTPYPDGCSDYAN